MPVINLVSWYSTAGGVSKPHLVLGRVLGLANARLVELAYAVHHGLVEQSDMGAGHGQISP